MKSNILLTVFFTVLTTYAVSQATIFFDDFETNTGWTLTGEFEISQPLGLGGEHGNPDPSSAYSGTKVLGIDLTGLGSYPGDYENNLSDRAYIAISPTIDCSNYISCRLKFQRYLGVESDSYDKAYIDISNDGGSSWTNIWTNGSSTISESAWSLQNIDISTYADGQANVKIRFAIGLTDVGWQYCGWNIDDFEIEGTPNCNTYAYTWTGNINSDWNNSGNWYGGSVPTSSSDVIIPATCVSNWPVLNADANCKNLTIESGAQLSCSSYNLNVYGDWVNNGIFYAETGSVYFKGNNNASLTVSGSSQTIFSEGFESGTSGWTLGSVANHTEWRRQSGVPHTGSYDCALYDIYHNNAHDFNYTGDNIYIDLSKRIDLSDYASSSITYYWRNNGDDWSHTLFSFDGHIYTDDMDNGGSSWHQETFDLTPYCGNSDILMFFRMWAGSQVGGTAPGLCIDDITITGIPNVESFNNVYIQKTGGASLTLASSLKTENNLIISSGTLNANNFNLTIGGNFTNNSNFISGTGTVKFNGTVSQTISGSNNISFYNFIKNSGSDLIFTGNNNTIIISNSFTWKDNDDKILIDGANTSVIINDKVLVNMGCKLDVNNGSTISIAKNFQNLGTINFTDNTSELKFHSNNNSYVLTEPGDTIFFDDFESDPFGGSSSWYFDQGNARSDWNWSNGQQHSGSRDLAVMDNHGSTKYYYDYQWDSPEDSCMARIDIDLTNYTGAILEFWWRCGGDDPDQASYNGDYGQVFINDIPITEKLWGQQNYVKHQPISLANYAGQVVTLKFKFYQDGTWNNGHAASPGLCVDDILIYANCTDVLHVHDLTVEKDNNSTSTVVLCPINANNDITITKGILDASGNNISLKGNWTNAVNTVFLPRRDTVIFDGSNNKFVDIGSTSFANVFINKPSATLTIQNNTLDIDSTLKIFSNSTLKSSGNNIEVGRDWINYGTFTHDNNTVIFDGKSNIYTEGTNWGKSFYNVTLNGTSATLFNDILIGNDFTITTGTWDVSNSNYEMTVYGNWISNGTFNHRTGNVNIRGVNTVVSFSSGGFYNLSLMKNSNTNVLTCLSDFDVSNNLTITLGGIDLKDKTINLGTTGTLIGETNDNRIFSTDALGIEGAGTGTITATRTNPSGNIAGLGCEIYPTINMGVTNIIRGHKIFTDIDGQGHSSIIRYFDILPANNSGLNATFRFHYFENELFGQTENDLEQWRSTDTGVSWTNRNGTANPSSDFVELSGIDAFSRWTLSGKDFPLPITLLKQKVECINECAKISWTTQSEINNNYFTIERSLDAYNFEEIGTISGAGTSNEIHNYYFIDDDLKQEAYYRIKQTDFDGISTYSDVLQSNCLMLSNNTKLNVEYRNSSIVASLSGNNLYNEYIVKLVSASGKIIENKIICSENGKVVYTINKNILVKGIYFIKFYSNGNNYTSKIIVY